MRFEGKTVVVTGASSGIGQSVALEFAKEGATVIAVARRKERLDALAEEAQDMAGKILPFVGDVSSKEAAEGMIDFAVEQGGKLDVVVNNAGIMDEFRPIDEVSDELWDKVMAVNLYGPAMIMRKAVQVMLEQESGGNIVNTASIGGVRGARAGAAYTASKHAIIGLSKNTAYMYAHRGIRCNAVCPGGVDTEVMASQTNISEFGVGRVMAGLDATIPSAKPIDIAAAILFAASDEAKALNGAELIVDSAVSSN